MLPICMYMILSTREAADLDQYDCSCLEFSLAMTQEAESLEHKRTWQLERAATICCTAIVFQSRLSFNFHNCASASAAISRDLHMSPSCDLQKISSWSLEAMTPCTCVFVRIYVMVFQLSSQTAHTKLQKRRPRCFWSSEA